MMHARFAAAALVMAVCAAPLAAAPLAQAPAPAGAGEIVVGASVQDAGGANLGRVDSLIRDSQGQVRQVLVRTPGIAGARTQLKSLPVTSLRPSDRGYVIALRRPEFDALPSVNHR